VFFVQDRVGRLGRDFSGQIPHHASVKERTIGVVCDNGGGSPAGKDAPENSARRAPQFVIILRGDMNIVGPAHTPFRTSSCSWPRIPHYPLRGIIRPGMTGWAQVRYGYANNLEEETEKMRYDSTTSSAFALGPISASSSTTVKLVALGPQFRHDPGAAGHDSGKSRCPSSIGRRDEQENSYDDA